MAQITLNSTGVASNGALVLQSNGTTTAVTINASQGVEVIAGTAALPAITTTGDTNTGIFFPAADTIAFTEGGVEAMRIDSSGNVGIGTNSPTERLHVSAANIVARFNSSTAFAGTLYTSSTTTGFGRSIAAEADAMTFGRYGVAEHMRIDSSGNVGIGTNAPSTKLHIATAINTGLLVSSTDGTTFKGIAFNTNDNQFTVGTTTNHPLVIFTNNAERARIDTSGNLLVGASGTPNGKVHISGSVIYTVPATFSASIGANAGWTTGFGSQAINLSLWASSGIAGVSVYNVSDRRLKEKIVPLTGAQAISFIEKAKPVQFVWKEEQTTDTGFIAQDILAAGFGHLVSAIADKAVHEETDENGNVSPAGSRFVMKYDSVIPILTAAIQEQQALITALTARLDAANL